MPTDEHSTPIAGQAVSAQSRETYPSIQKLFSHTLAPEPFDAEDNYGGWESEQLGRPRFFLTGVKQLSSFLHTYEMKKYFELRDEAKALLMQRPEWTLVAPGILEPIAENQFNRAKNEDAITFERAVVIIAAFEVRYAQAIASGRCVTKDTAVLVKAELEELTGNSWNGRVRPNPGKFLGNKPTSTLEKIS